MRFTFHLFSPAHLAIIAAIPLIAAIFTWIQRRLGRESNIARFVLAGLLFAVTASYYANFILAGQAIFPAHLPLELCDASLWLMIVALLLRKAAVFDIAYFWALAGATMAVLTPNLATPTYFEAFEFFASHGLTVAAVLYLVWSRQARPRRWSIARAMIGVNIMAVIAGTFDYFYRTDYMFLRAKPAQASLLDFLGPWPWYILSCEFVGLALFVLLYLPFWRGNSQAHRGVSEKNVDKEVSV